jgi:hypothetical protein
MVYVNNKFSDSCTVGCMLAWAVAAGCGVGSEKAFILCCLCLMPIGLTLPLPSHVCFF